MSDLEITVTVDLSRLSSYSDKHLAGLWHVAQLNPAPHGDRAAGDLAGKLSAEIVRRWLLATEPEMYRHQQRDYYWSELGKVAQYEPGGPATSPTWHDGRWVPKGDPEGEGA